MRLTSGRVGVVLEGNDQETLAPRLNIFFDSKRKAYLAPYQIDLARPPAKYKDEKLAGFEDPLQWGIKIEDFLVS